MDDVREDFLGPPHGTTPAAVIANKNVTYPLRAVNILMRKGMGRTVVRITPLIGTTFWTETSNCNVACDWPEVWADLPR